MNKRLSTTTRALRVVFIVLWVSVILACVGTYVWDPAKFTPERIAEFLGQFEGTIWLVYIIFSALRGLTLLPSTPLVIAGTLLFPDQQFAVLAVSMIGILASSTMIYYGSEYLGFSEYFEGHSPALVHRIKDRLEKPLGEIFVAAWAFFPLVPTDLVCYLAGITRMRFWKFILAIFVGELILCVCYIFLGGTLLQYVS